MKIFCTLLILLLVSLGGVSCGKNGFAITFKVIDADTGLPISDVRAVWSEIEYSPVDPGDFKINNVDAGHTMEDGSIYLEGLKKIIQSDFPSRGTSIVPVYSSVTETLQYSIPKRKQDELLRRKNFQ